MIFLKIGDTALIPPREITRELIDEKIEWSRAHQAPHTFDPTLARRVGQKARVLRAYASMQRDRPDDPVVGLAVGDYGVTVSGMARGRVLVDVIDEVSDPGGVTGVAGGVEFLVGDELDELRFHLAQPELPAPTAGVPIEEPAARLADPSPGDSPGDPAATDVMPVEEALPDSLGGGVEEVQ